MNRRGFLRSIQLGAGASAAAIAAPGLVTAPAITPTPDSDVDRLIAACPPGQFGEFLGRRVMWTGWKPQQATVDFAAQWVMEVRHKGEPTAVTFAISHPGNYAILQRGACLCLDYRFPQAVTFEAMTTKNACAVFDVAQKIMAEVLLEYIHNEDEIVSEWSSHNMPYLQPVFPWAKLRSWRTKFYLDPCRWCAEEAGIDPHSSAGEAFLEQARRRLYGLAEV